MNRISLILVVQAGVNFDSVLLFERDFERRIIVLDLGIVSLVYDLVDKNTLLDLLYLGD